MTKPIKIYPFTEDQLRFFQKEIEEAGGIRELLVKKEALIKNDQSHIIAKYENIEGYKNKYLVGIYKPLRYLYKSKVPFVFWSKLFAVLKRI